MFYDCNTERSILFFLEVYDYIIFYCRYILLLFYYIILLKWNRVQHFYVEVYSVSPPLWGSASLFLASLCF